MKIIVLVKMVPDGEANVVIKGNGEIEIEEKYELNYFDELAVEEAIRLKERYSDIHVTAITFGPKRTIEALRKAIAMGADHAVYIPYKETSYPLDPFMTARVLGEAIRKIDFDLIICGRKATDDESSQVGPMIAEFLSIPHVSSVVDVDIEDENKTVMVKRDYEGGKEVLKCSLPMLISAQKGLNEPRTPTIQGVMKGMKLKPEVIELSDIGVSESNMAMSNWKSVGYKGPKKRPPVKIIDGEDAISKAKRLFEIMRDELGVLVNQ